MSLVNKTQHETWIWLFDAKKRISKSKKSSNLQEKFRSMKYKLLKLPSLKLTAKAPENGWLEDDPASFWVNRPIFRGVCC